MADHSPVREMCLPLVGNIFGYKGYLSQTLTQYLLLHRLRVVNGLRQNMLEQQQPLWDTLLLRTRAQLETVLDQLKNISQIPAPAVGRPGCGPTAHG